MTSAFDTLFYVELSGLFNIKYEPKNTLHNDKVEIYFET